MKHLRILLLVLLAGLLVGCNFTLAADVTPPPGYQPEPVVQAPVAATSGPVYPLVPPNPANGEATFAEKCAPCHGAAGLGDGPQSSQLSIPVAALASPEVGRQGVPSEWFTLVTKGNLERFMPPFQSLTDRERWDVVAYALSLSAPPQILAQGEEIYKASCSSCHGEMGKGDGAGASGLEAMPPDFTNQLWMAENTNADFFKAISTGLPPAMPAFESQFSEDERWALAAYIRSLSFERSATLESAVTTPAPGLILTPDVAIQSTITATASLSETLTVGAVVGSVINVSGGDLGDALQVTLHGFDQMNAVLTETTTLAADGTYAFQNLEMPEGRIFLSTVDFGGITYGSEIATVGPEPQIFDLPIEIYETTTDTSVLTVDRLHFFFEFLGPEIVRVSELYIVTNPTQQTVISEDPSQPVISFTVPEKAANLEFQDGVLGGRYIETEDGFGDTVPIRPGSGVYQVLFSYEMPYSRKLELVREMQLATNAVVILIPENGMEIKGDTLEDAGTREVQDTVYRLYNGRSMAPGQELSLTISGRMVSESINDSSSLLIGLGALGVVLVVAGIWLYQRNVQKPLVGEGPKETIKSPDQESAETIMDAILTLDDLYQAGELPEEAYIQRRNELKVRLRQLLNPNE